MENESIQEGAPVVPQRELADYDYDSRGQFSRETLHKEREHLKLLSIFYFILAGMNAVGGVISLIYVPIGIFLLVMGGSNNNGPPPVVGIVLIVVGVFVVGLSALWAYTMYVTGRSLRECKRRQFIFVAAILLCILGGVVGIVLGLFTIIALNRDSVKQLFKEVDLGLQRNEDA